MLIQTPSTSANQRLSPFLRLPPELRNQIYELVFQEVSVRRVCRARSSKSRPTYVCLAPGDSLLRACRQLNRESRPFKQACTTLAFINQSYRFIPVDALRQLVGPSFCQALRVLRIYNELARKLRYGSASAGWKSQSTPRDTFPSLERIIVSGMLNSVRRWKLKCRYKLRLVFDKRDLEVIYE